MPEELKSAEEFLSVAEIASKCYVKTNPDNVKLKLRTSNVLYTFKTDSQEAESLLRRINIDTEEIK